MKNLFLILMSLMVTVTLTACPDKEKSGNTVATAPAPGPDSGQRCYHDWRYNNYRYEDGRDCTYDDWYGQNENACFNYYYNQYHDKYYDSHGNPVRCDRTNNFHNTVTNYYYGYWSGNNFVYYQQCPIGYIKQDFGGGYYRCIYQTYNTNPYLNWDWYLWINL